MWRLAYSIPLWLVYTLVYAVLIAIGWVLIPIAALFRAYDYGQASTGLMYHFTWPFMWLWDNYEDGIAAGRQYKDCGPVWKQIIYWSCIRNPVNNLRIVPYLSCIIDSTRVNYIGEVELFKAKSPQDDKRIYILRKFDTKVPQWFFAWQGLYSNFYWQFVLRGTLRRFWIGWKIYPIDVCGLSENSYRKHGAGFALQFKVVK